MQFHRRANRYPTVSIEFLARYDSATLVILTAAPAQSPSRGRCEKLTQPSATWF